jgi:hypothetical protein
VALFDHFKNTAENDSSKDGCGRTADAAFIQSLSALSAQSHAAAGGVIATANGGVIAAAKGGAIAQGAIQFRPSARRM